MTGVTMHVRIMADGPREAIGRLMRLGTDPRTLLPPIGTGMVRVVQDRFRNAEDPQGKAWVPLRPDYAAAKRRGAGILRGAAMAGGLMGSITRDVQGYDLAVGTSKIYGAPHQFGAIIRPRSASSLVYRIGNRVVFAKQVTIPARPYLGWGAAEEEVVLEVTEALFDRAIAAGAQAASRGPGRIF
ncbi:phage virion morphogenesis protein [Falsiroseomonas sp.]|uniref:phage virion morphogenesis protein n=1 Tax=Falsiroseomonas sp. TaxID=2870721 RepID=UPI00271C1884|nr:phage virion morphogenesis protein [Falsiroseomonas sp.]MDO9501398.1 phage virion morphogenesis protein [Falsiroseomonas sp.]